MGLTAGERQRLRGRWLALARAAAATDPEALAGAAREARDWASPFDHKAHSYVMFALARLAYAFVLAGHADRVKFADALAFCGGLAVRLLADDGPPQAALPFRADLDG